MRWLYLLLIVAFLHSPRFVFAQVADIKFRHITSDDGLSQNTIFSIVKDVQGFMWFGTRDGLCKYDGYRFIVYRNNPKDSGSISHNLVWFLFEDKDHNLWIGTDDGGLNMYDRETDKFIHYKNDPADMSSLSSNEVSCIYEDKTGNLWIGTDGGGLNRFNKKTGTFTRYNYLVARKGLSLKHQLVPGALMGPTVRTITEDSKGRLWVGTEGGGVSILDRKTNSFKHYLNDEDNPGSLSGNGVLVVYEDRNKNIWVGTTEGLNLFEESSGCFTRILSDDRVQIDQVFAISEDSKGALWIGTLDGLFIRNGGTSSFKAYRYDEFNKNSLSNNFIRAIYRDNIGTMWLGTFHGGVNIYYYEEKKFRHFKHEVNKGNSLADNIVRAIYEDRNGNIWVGTNNGLDLFEKEKGIFKHFKTDKGRYGISRKFIISIYEDRSQNLWVGTHGGGFSSFDRSSGQFGENYVYENDDSTSLSSNLVSTIFEDSRKNLWIGTWSWGLDLFDRQRKIFQHFRNNRNDSTSLSFDVIFSILEDRKGNLWVGTVLGGLNLYDYKSGKFKHFKNRDNDSTSLSNNTVNFLFEDNAGSLWVGTNGGLNKMDRKTATFTSFNEKDGLPNEVIQGILEDEKGNLWLSTNKGISKFNPKTGKFKNYDITDGLQGNEFNTGTCFKSRTGELFFGGNNGFNYFYPDSIRDNTFIPPVVFTDLKIFNKSVVPGSKSPLKKPVSLSKEIHLSYDHSVFTIEFAALNYIHAKKNQYAYMLEKFDENWNYVGTNRSATYTNLDPGEYVFRVKGSNNDGIWNNDGASIKIIITPPFWYTLWFRWGLVLIVAFAAFTFYRIRIHSIKLQRAQLSTQNEELKKINAELDKFVYRASHDLRAPLTSILGLINITRIETDENNRNHYFSLMEKSINKLDTFIQSIINYSRNSRLEVKRSLIDFESLIWESFDELKYMEGSQAIDKIVNIELNEPFFSDEFRLKIIFNNLISNAIRYRNPKIPGYIKISLVCVNKNLVIEVADNGIGIPAESISRIFDMFYRASQNNIGSGLGLYIVKEVTTALGGAIEVDSRVGEGTVFLVRIPCGK